MLRLLTLSALCAALILLAACDSTVHKGTVGTTYAGACRWLYYPNQNAYTCEAHRNHAWYLHSAENRWVEVPALPDSIQYRGDVFMPVRHAGRAPYRENAGHIEEFRARQAPQ